MLWRKYKGVWRKCRGRGENLIKVAKTVNRVAKKIKFFAALEKLQTGHDAQIEEDKAAALKKRRTQREQRKRKLLLWSREASNTS
jgi:hypothetical protein